MDYRIINLNTVMDSDSKLGGLSYVESEIDIPFPIRRFYYLYHVDADMHRGFHAHKKNWQLMCCPYGSIEIVLKDDIETEVIVLDQPAKGLLLTPGLWREMIWKKQDSVLCVAASEHYDPDDYIRDFDEYLVYMKEKNANRDI